MTHLAIAAHQDDIEFMAFDGIVKCLDTDADKSFGAVVVTQSNNSPRGEKYKDMSAKDMAQLRESEQVRASEIGKYAYLKQLNYPSEAVRGSSESSAQIRAQVVRDLYEILMAHRPEVLYLHNLADKHETHVAVALRAIEAARQMPKELRPKEVLGCEVWRDLDWLEDTEKVRLDVSGHDELAKNLIGAFESQTDGSKDYTAAVIGRRSANAVFGSPYEAEGMTHVTNAMDLTPLVENEDADIAEFVQKHINKFSENVVGTISKLRKLNIGGKNENHYGKEL